MKNNKKLGDIFIEECCSEFTKETIVFCHGITGCRKGRTMDDDYFQKLAEKLMKLNYKVVLFDFSGHVNSDGKDKDVALEKSTEELRNLNLMSI